MKQEFVWFGGMLDMAWQIMGDMAPDEVPNLGMLECF